MATNHCRAQSTCARPFHLYLPLFHHLHASYLQSTPSGMQLRVVLTPPQNWWIVANCRPLIQIWRQLQHPEASCSFLFSTTAFFNSFLPRMTSTTTAPSLTIAMLLAPALPSTNPSCAPSTFWKPIYMNSIKKIMRDLQYQGIIWMQGKKKESYLIGNGWMECCLKMLHLVQHSQQLHPKKSLHQFIAEKQV